MLGANCFRFFKSKSGLRKECFKTSAKVNMLTLFEYLRFSLVLAFLGLSGCNGLGGADSAKVEAASPVAAAAGSMSGYIIAPNPDYRLPSRVSLCGEALDLGRQSVYERLEF